MFPIHICGYIWLTLILTLLITFNSVMIQVWIIKALRERNRNYLYREHQTKRSTCIFITFPIRTIYVDFHIDIIVHIVFRMIQFWIKNLARKKSYLHLHVKYYYFSSHMCCLTCFRCEVFMLTMILIFLLKLFKVIQFWTKTLEIFTSP